MTETRHRDQEQQKMTYQDAKNIPGAQKKPQNIPNLWQFYRKNDFLPYFCLTYGCNIVE